MTEDDYLALPEEIRIREFAAGGRVYVTTLMNSKTYHKKTLTKLYKKRWTIELDFRSIKTNLGMEVLRCKSAEMVRKESGSFIVLQHDTCKYRTFRRNE